MRRYTAALSLVIVLCLSLTYGCENPSPEVVTPVAQASSRPVENTPASMPSTLPAEELPEVHLLNSDRYAVQVFATQVENEVLARLGAVERLGYRATIARAELGERGTWFRLLLGSLSRRDLAEMLGMSIDADKELHALLPPVQPSEPRYLILKKALTLELAPRAVKAVAKLVSGRDYRAAVARFQSGAPQGAMLSIGGDPRVRLIDAAGAVASPLPAPRFPGCAACSTAASGGRLQSIDILLVDDLAFDDASEALLSYQYGKTRLASLIAFAGGAEKPARELGGFVISEGDANRQLRGHFRLVNGDTDADAEVLFTQYALLSHEGDLCSVQKRTTLFDITSEGLRPLDESHFAGLATAGNSEREYLAFAKTARNEGAYRLLFRTGVAYLSQGSAKAEVGRWFFDALKQYKAADADLVRVETLAWLAAARPEYKTSLAPVLFEVLQRLVANPKLRPRLAGCDEAPLLRAKTWTIDKPDKLPKYVQASQSRANLLDIPDAVYGTIARTYEPKTAIYQKLEELIALLKQASGRHKAVLQLVQKTREAAGRK